MKSLLYIGLILALSSIVNSSCPSRKNSRKQQIVRLKSLDENVVIVEATYWRKFGDRHMYVYL